MRDSERYEEDLLPAAFFIFCFAKRAEVAKASPNLKDKEVAIKLCRIWNQLGEEEQAPYFSAAAKYPQRERAEMGECLSEALERMGVNMSSVEQAADAPAVVEAPTVEAPAVVEAPAAKATKKTKVKGKDSASGNPKYKDMVMDAIITQKERSGSSLGAIKNHLGSKYKVDVAKKAGILNRLQFIDNINILCVCVLSV